MWKSNVLVEAEFNGYYKIGSNRAEDRRFQGYITAVRLFNISSELSGIIAIFCLDLLNSPFG